MENLKFDKEITALLVIDPYNDFISEGGKVWDRLRVVAEANNCVPHVSVECCAESGASRFLRAAYRPGDHLRLGSILRPSRR